MSAPAQQLSPSRLHPSITSQSVNMPFEFIDNNGLLNDAARKRIRRHAASGRNKGKKITRPSRRDVSTTTATSFRIPRMMERVSEAVEKGSDIERPIDDALLFPILLHGESKGFVKKGMTETLRRILYWLDWTVLILTRAQCLVVSFMSAIRYSPELSNGLDYAGLSTSLCVQYMFVDEACFHCAMAPAILCLNKLVSKPEGMVQAMRHVSHAFRLVNQKLSSQSAVTDLTIVAIVNMAQHEHHQNQYQQGFAHVQGLRRIAQLRGGVSQLMESTSGLVQKMFRIDLEYSLQLGSSTLFTVEEALMGCKTTTQFPSLYLRQDNGEPPLILGQHPFETLPANFRDLLVDMTFLASLLNNAIAGAVPKLDGIDFHKDTLLLGYRLVKLKPLGLPLEICSLQNRVRLGLTAFLVTFLQGWDGRVAQNVLLSKSLLLEVQQPFDARQGSQEVLLWLLFIGAASSCLWKHLAWVSTTKQTMHGLGITSWEDVKKILAKYPWVNAVHDPAGQALWYGSNKVHSDDAAG